MIVFRKQSFSSFTDSLHGDPAECICHGAEQNDQCKHRAEILDHDKKDFLSAEAALTVDDFFLDFRHTDDSRNERRQVAMAAIGIITEFVRKSKKSRNCMPRMVTEESGP